MENTKKQSWSTSRPLTRNQALIKLSTSMELRSKKLLVPNFTKSNPIQNNSPRLNKKRQLVDKMPEQHFNSFQTHTKPGLKINLSKKNIIDKTTVKLEYEGNDTGNEIVDDIVKKKVKVEYIEDKPVENDQDYDIEVHLEVYDDELQIPIFNKNQFKKESKHQHTNYFLNHITNVRLDNFHTEEFHSTISRESNPLTESTETVNSQKVVKLKPDDTHSAFYPKEEFVFAPLTKRETVESFKIGHSIGGVYGEVCKNIGQIKIEKDECVMQEKRKEMCKNSFDSDLCMSREGHYSQGDSPFRIIKMRYDQKISDLSFTMEWRRLGKDQNLMPSDITRQELIKYDPLLLVYFYEKHLEFPKFSDFQPENLPRIPR